MFNLVSLNKFQGSSLTFDFSAKVAHIGVPSTYKHIVLLETTWPIETNFHMATPYDWLAKTQTNCYGHMTYMVTMPIYGKNYLNLYFSRTKGHWLWDFVCSIGDLGPSRFAKMMNLC